MIPVKSIEIHQAEGRTDRMIRKTVETFDAAHAALRDIARQCPPDMLGYFKTDVTIVWDCDDTSQVFRCDVNQNFADCNLTAMLRRWAEHYKVNGKSPNLKRYLSEKERAEWEDHARRLLDGELAVLDG